MRKSRFITGTPLGALTPSAIVAAPDGGFYVSSVLTGVIAEYSATGRFVRRILDPPLVNPLPPVPGGTPYGMVVDDEGSLWYADLGVELTLPDIGPVDGHGTVRRIRFVDGAPLEPEIMRAGLDFPDGLGLVPLVAGSAPTPTDPSASSEWPCGSWGMYGAGVGRTFSTECPTGINTVTARTMVPVWTVRMPRTVTASPAVVAGTVYVGDWGGTMHALRLSDGGERWQFQTAAAPGATFGPIVSSAAVADVEVGATTKRLVVFGAGPRLYALDAANGHVVWVHRPIDGHRRHDHGGRVLPGHPRRDRVRGHRHPQPARGATPVACGVASSPSTPPPAHSCGSSTPSSGNRGAGCGGVWSSPAIDRVERTVLLATANCPAAG